MKRKGTSEGSGTVPPAEPGRRDLADLAMLADGTLPQARRDEVQARIAALPGGPELLTRERRAVEALRAATEVRAPASLRGMLAAQHVSHGRPRQRERAVLGGGIAAALAVLVFALVLVLPGGTPGSPSVSQAAVLGLQGPTQPAPPARAGHGSTLARDVEEVYFPNWKAIGWTATGARADRVDGRLLDTVYYRGYGKRIAYTIVGGAALAQSPAGSTRGKPVVAVLRVGGHVVATWRRHGHTCILATTGVPVKRLVALAARER